MTFKIIRNFQNDTSLNEVIATGLTRKEATAHCRDPETSWRTAKSPEKKAITAEKGPWFDSFDEE